MGGGFEVVAARVRNKVEFMRTRVSIVIVFLALMMSAGAVPVKSAELVWSGLVIAENVAKPTAIPPELSSIEQTLKELFGYNQLQVIGQSRKTLRSGDEDWLAASKYFSLHVDAQGEGDSGYGLDLKLYKEQELLLQTSTKLSKQSPLVIKGPLVGNAQLLLVLIAEEADHGASQRQIHRPGRDLADTWHRFRRTMRGLLP
jgi:hypothetical protein